MSHCTRTRVKICGVTRAEDARAAVAAGADAVGVVAYDPSPRTARIENARAIRDSVPAFVSLVLVTVDLDEARHRQWIEALAPDLLQFHGSEAPVLCDGFGLPYIKSLRMRDDVDIEAFEERYARARAVLLDTFVPGVVGGTGRRFDWRLAARCRKLPVVLAGGLEARAVAQALREASPYALDVSSSLEVRPGVKDHRLIAEFMQAVREADDMRTVQLHAAETQ